MVFITKSIKKMTDNQAIKLIGIYLKISDLYENELKYHCQRFSNNNEPIFTDVELITIYLYSMIYEERFKIKQIYNFANNYLRSWFPDLSSYVAFNNRLNRLPSVFKHLCYLLLPKDLPLGVRDDISLLDSMPIITCSGKRKGKVAQNITDKGFCSTKGMYYFGLKLHILGFWRKGRLPFPESFVITPASENDLNVFKNYWSDIVNRTFYGDKIYIDEPFFEKLKMHRNVEMLTPVKKIKGEPECIRKMHKAADDLYSKAVSKIRQPIEALFSWIIEKTDIQRASKVRSENGLLVHMFGRMAAAFLAYNF